ncbi:MAG: hypothetical protein ACYTF5_10110, partial [Planctomycetota bacterium]
MLRRTALILTGFLFLALVATIGYALSGLGGPEYTIHRARQALQEEDYVEAIRLADIALSDRALDRNKDLRRAALRVRYQAYSEVGSYKQALLDLAELIEKLRDSDIRLVLSRIEIILDRARRDRDMPQVLSALKRAERVLNQQPDNPQALALAGDACRIVYEDRVLELREQLTGVLPPRLLRQAMAKLTESTFRSVDDPRVAVLEKEILALLPDGKNHHHELRNKIRTWVQHAQVYCLRALRLRQPHVRAYLGIDAILKAVGREDQRLALAEIYMQRAGPKDSITATAVAARLHLEKGRYRACVTTADRVLARTVWRRLVDQKMYSPAVPPLLLCKHLALARLGATAAMQDSTNEVKAMVPEMPIEWHPLYDLIQGIGLAGTADAEARSHLEAFCDAKELPSDDWTERQLLGFAYETRVEVERRLGSNPETIAGLLLDWTKRDRRNPKPLIRMVRLYLDAGRSQLALGAAANAMRVAENDDDVLRLYAETAAAMVADGPRDLPNLIQRCRSLQKTVPDNIGDIEVLVLPLAEYALRTEDLDIATACAQVGADRYSWARWPRYLRIEAALLAGRPADATLDLEVLLRYHPGDRRANEFLSRVLAGDPEQAENLRYASAVYGAPNLATARFLGRQLYARGEWDRLLALTRVANERFRADQELMSLAARVLLRRGDHDNAGLLLAAIHRLPRGTEPRSPWALGQFILWNPARQHPAQRAATLEDYLAAEPDGGQLFELARALRAKGDHGLAYRAATVLVTGKQFEKQRTGAWFQLAGRAALQLDHLEQARDHLVAAAGFGDGKAAALDLTLLHMAQEDLVAARESFVQSPRNSITAACVAARLGQKDGAVARIRYRVAADPEHLETLCMLACLDPEAKVPAAVRDLARGAGDELLELLAFLSTDAFHAIALRRATALARAHTDNPVAVLLGLRAFVRAGQHKGVVPTLLSLKLSSPILLGEALRILSASDSPELRDSRLMNYLLTYVAAKGATAEPALLALVIRHDKRLLAQDGNRAAVLSAIADFWIRHPALADAGLDEVDMLVNAGMHKTAIQLLEVIENRLPTRSRSRFLRTFYTTAARVVAAEPHLAAPLMDRAQKILTAEGAHGAVLHFLLETKEACVPWPQDPVARAKRRNQEILLLRAHVERYHATRDRTDHDHDRNSYLKSLERLFRLEDPARSLSRIDAMLQADPALLDLWCYRARRLVQAGRLGRAIDSLAWIPAYLEDDTVENVLVPLRLRRGDAGATDAPPDSALARGLLALRDGDFDAAVEALGQAEPQVDGSHLFYLALANLGNATPEHRQLAA